MSKWLLFSAAILSKDKPTVWLGIRLLPITWAHAAGSRSQQNLQASVTSSGYSSTKWKSEKAGKKHHHTEWNTFRIVLHSIKRSLLWPGKTQQRNNYLPACPFTEMPA